MNAPSKAIPILVCLALAACGYSEEEMQARITRISELETELEETRSESQRREAALQERLNEMSEQNQELAGRLRELGQEVEGLVSERVDLQQTLAQTESNLAATESNLAETQRALEALRAEEREQRERVALFQRIVSQFRSMIDSGRLRVRVVRNRMVIELSEGILFDSGRARIKPEGEAALTEIVQILTTLQNREFQVAGHTDNVPMRSSRFASNWELSTARAVTVTRFMVEQGMPAARISAAGFADTHPVASNDSSEGRAQNRRIEITLVPNLDELPDLSGITNN